MPIAVISQNIMSAPNPSQWRTDELTSALALLEPIDTLAALLDQVRAHAEQAGLLVFPTVPEHNRQEVRVPPSEMHWAEFLDFAAHLHVGVVYLAGTHFDVDEAVDVSVSGEEVNTEDQESARQALAPFQGMVDAVDLAFAHHGVWHRWSTTAKFAAALANASGTAAGSTDLTQEEARHVLDKLLAFPEVRAASSLAALLRAARKYPEVSRLINRKVIVGSSLISGFRYTCDAVQEMARTRSEALQRQLPELAQELADANEFQAAASASMRKTIAGQFLDAKADGYHIPKALRDDLAARARHIQRTRRS
ncbi:hypothetical protein [Saccharopolyspora sp. NPDC003762]